METLFIVTGTFRGHPFYKDFTSVTKAVGALTTLVQNAHIGDTLRIEVKDMAEVRDADPIDWSELNQ